jgi:hypothetical protein
MTNPRVIDNGNGIIRVQHGGEELRGWTYTDGVDRFIKRQLADAYVEGWCDGRDAPKSTEGK